MKVSESLRGPSGRWDPLSICPADRLPLLRRYDEMLGDVNRRVNLISRESVEERWVRHVVHSLCLGWKAFPPGARVVDWGTGGGLPCIPLGIAFPAVAFVGIDAVGKKVMAVRSMARRLGLDNVDAVHVRAEKWNGRVDFSVSRATAPLSTLWSWHTRVADSEAHAVDACWPPGLICLKGGDLGDEVTDLQRRYPSASVDTIPLADVTSIPEFVGKHIVVVTTEVA